MRPERGHHGLRMELRILGEQLEDDPGSGLRRFVSLEVDDHLEVQAEAFPDEVVQPGHPGRRELILEHVLLGNVQFAHLVESHFGYPAAPEGDDGLIQNLFISQFLRTGEITLGE